MFKISLPYLPNEKNYRSLTAPNKQNSNVADIIADDTDVYIPFSAFFDSHIIRVSNLTDNNNIYFPSNSILDNLFSNVEDGAILNWVFEVDGNCTVFSDDNPGGISVSTGTYNLNLQITIINSVREIKIYLPLIGGTVALQSATDLVVAGNTGVLSGSFVFPANGGPNPYQVVVTSTTATDDITLVMDSLTNYLSGISNSGKNMALSRTISTTIQNNSGQQLLIVSSGTVTATGALGTTDNGVLRSTFYFNDIGGSQGTPQQCAVYFERIFGDEPT